MVQANDVHTDESMRDDKELLIECGRLMTKLVVSLRIHKQTAAAVEMIESDPRFQPGVKQFQPQLERMEKAKGTDPADAQVFYETLQELLTIAADQLR
jgi:hypothetical protein